MPVIKRPLKPGDDEKPPQSNMEELSVRTRMTEVRSALAAGLGCEPLLTESDFDGTLPDAELERVLPVDLTQKLPRSLWAFLLDGGIGPRDWAPVVARFREADEAGIRLVSAEMGLFVKVSIRGEDLERTNPVELFFSDWRWENVLELWNIAYPEGDD